MPAALRALAESGIFEYNPATEVNFFVAADTAPDSVQGSLQIRILRG